MDDSDGLILGACDEAALGLTDSCSLGVDEGLIDGDKVGVALGSTVGCSVGLGIILPSAPMIKSDNVGFGEPLGSELGLSDAAAEG
jgi:hypothetical protein